MKNSSLKLEEITKAITQVGTLLTSLDTELDRENQAIRARNAELMTASTSAKITLLQSIEVSSRSLADLMVKHGYHDAEIGLKKGALSFELGDVWTSFCEKMELCNDKNIINGRAIELSKVSTDRIIDLLRGNDKPVYGRAGRMQDSYDIVPLAEA